jgi:hypothetical protein
MKFDLGKEGVIEMVLPGSTDTGDPIKIVKKGSHVIITGAKTVSAEFPGNFKNGNGFAHDALALEKADQTVLVQSSIEGSRKQIDVTVNTKSAKEITSTYKIPRMEIVGKKDKIKINVFPKGDSPSIFIDEVKFHKNRRK